MAWEGWLLMSWKWEDFQQQKCSRNDAQEEEAEVSHSPPSGDAAWSHNPLSAPPYRCLCFGVFTKGCYRNLSTSVHPGLRSSLLPLPVTSMELAAPGL